MLVVQEVWFGASVERLDDFCQGCSHQNQSIVYLPETKEGNDKRKIRNKIRKNKFHLDRNCSDVIFLIKQQRERQFVLPSTK